MTITLIYGPMFSGKTTKLIEIYENLILKDKAKCIAINYALDKRYGENKIISHDGLNIDCYSITNIEEFYNLKKQLILDADNIFINEAQFFESIDKWVLYLNQVLKKNVILCGLDLDYKREKFGTMMNLLPYAATIHKMTGHCAKCVSPSQFSYRIVNNDSQILIGNSEYIPLCEKCYDNQCLVGVLTS